MPNKKQKIETEQGAVALWSNSSRNFVELDRKIEGSKLAANSKFFEANDHQTRKKKLRDEFGNERKGAPAK